MPCKQAQAGTTSLIATVTLANPHTLFFALLKRGAALSILLSHHTAVSPHCCLTTLFSVLCSMKSLSWSSNTLLSFVLHEVVVQVQQHSSQFCAPVGPGPATLFSVLCSSHRPGPALYAGGVSGVGSGSETCTGLAGPALDAGGVPGVGSETSMDTTS